MAWLLVLLFSGLFWFVALRFISLPFLILAWALFLKCERDHLQSSLSAWAIWLGLAFSPIDEFPIPRVGLPRLVPLVMGLPHPDAVERAKPGEVILGGCIVSGFEPKYYLVW